MNKQLVNLIGAAASAAVLLLGVLVFALPLFSSANTTMSESTRVATQNATQQSVLDGLTEQAGDLAAIEAEVTALRLEIPETEHVEDVVELAAIAALEKGGRLRSVTPGTVGPFTPRTAEVVAAQSSGEEAPVVEAPAEETDATTSPATQETDAPTTTTPTAPVEGPQQVEVTVAFDTLDVATATAIIDALRVGPRLAAVTHAVVTTEDEKVTLTVTLLVFFRA
jgi:hypothetical protein